MVRANTLSKQVSEATYRKLPKLLRNLDRLDACVVFLSLFTLVLPWGFLVSLANLTFAVVLGVRSKYASSHSPH